MATLPPLAEGQTARQKPARRKPLAALSESAERLKGSVTETVTELVHAPRAPLLAMSVEHETALRDSIVAVARSQIGTRYRLGAEKPGKAFDCSGFVRYVLSMFSLELPRTAREQATMGDEVEGDSTSLRPGDLIAFGRGRRVSHIGIYVGNGRLVHASTSKRRVVESSIEGEGSWFQRRMISARSLLALQTTAPDSSVQQ
jgi:cell wall-associated NlpC family hydrolase